MSIIVIPAYQPDEKLVDLVRVLLSELTAHIIVINDGSDMDKNHLFQSIEDMNVTVLSHAVNLGKGQALKTAFNYVSMNFPDAIGVVTADADGQHSPKDIARICDQLKKCPTDLIMGGREFGGDIPFRSKFGNVLTRSILRVVSGISLRDTQTGLRGIPACLFPALLNIKSNRYEYETEMLIVTRQNKVPMQEIPIETIYIDENESSHFNVLYDSVRIYFSLLRFTIASLLTAGVDYAVFYMAFSFFDAVLPSLVVGRIVALSVNFLLVRNYVFLTREEGIKQFPAYLALVIALGTLSYFGITTGITMFDLHPIVAKIIVEGALFFMSFLVQRDFIFIRRGNR